MKIFHSSLINVGLRHAKGHFLQSFLLILGIALGVSVIVAIDLANVGVNRSFQLSTESVTGKATHQIQGPHSKIDQSIYTRLRVQLGFRQSAPLVDGFVRVQEFQKKTMRLLGVDLFAEAPFRQYLQTGLEQKRQSGVEQERQSGVEQEGLKRDELKQGGLGFASNDFSYFLTRSNQVVIAASLAQEYQLKKGDFLHLKIGNRQIKVQILALLPSALSGILLTDIATAQEILGLKDEITHIDLILDENDLQLEEQIKALLPPEIQLVPTKAKSHSMREMSKTFEQNLTAMSLLALLVGVFLIYNTVSFSVVQRRPVLGTLRALGVTRKEVFWMIIGETLVLGMIGTLFGLLLGIGLGKGTVQMVSQTISDLYFTLTVNQFPIAPQSLLKGFVIGIAASLFSVIFPALEAIRVEPASVLRRSTLEKKIYQSLPYLTAFGILLLVVGWGLLQIPVRQLEFSFIGVFGVAIGAAFLVPILTLVFLKIVFSPVSFLFGIVGRMATRNISRSLSRTGIAIAALMVAISVIIGVGTMVGSFRYTLVNWLEDTLQADLYIGGSSRGTGGFNPKLLEKLGEMPEIARIYPSQIFRMNSGKYANSQFNILEQDHSKRSWMWALGDDEQRKKRFKEGWIFISEPFAWKHQIEGKEGASITLNTSKGPKEFPIAGIFSDFSAQQGSLLIQKDIYLEYWSKIEISNAEIFLRPNVDAKALVKKIESKFSADYPFFITSNVFLRKNAIRIFDRTFKITIALQILAAVVAFIGILNTILSLILERTQEIGILRANGMTRRQLWRMILVESGLIGFIAGIFAFPLGTALAWILVFLINKKSFGWTLDFVLSPQDYLQALAISIVASLLAGIYPAYRVGKIEIAQALRAE